MKSEKKQIIKSLAVLTIFFSIQGVGFSQQDLTLYNLQRLPQANWTNPALQPECNLNIGGAIVPVFGQILFPVHFNYANNTFALNEVFPYGTGQYSDSLIHPMHPNFDKQAFLGNLREISYFGTEFHINWLNVGYKYDGIYFNLSVMEKIDTRFGIPKDLPTLLMEGNGQSFFGETASINGLGLSFKHYREYSLGVSKQFMKNLYVGARLKMLFGKANINTRKSDLEIHTDNTGNYPMTFSTDMEFNTSLPFFEVQKMEYDYEKDSIIFDTEVNGGEDITTSDIKKDYIFNHKNLGFALDIGAVYKFNDDIILNFSALDLGYIRWKSNAATYKQKGEYYFDGIDIIPFAKEEDSTYLANLQDSVIHIFEVTHSTDPYNTWLGPKIYLGGTFALHEKIRFGLLGRAEIYNRSFHSSLTVSAISDLTPWFTATVNYSMMHRSYNNLGVGLYVKGAFMQFFVATDNILGFFYWSRSRNINLRMGANLVFGCKKDKKESVMF